MSEAWSSDLSDRYHIRMVNGLLLNGSYSLVRYRHTLTQRLFGIPSGMLFWELVDCFIAVVSTRHRGLYLDYYVVSISI